MYRLLSISIDMIKGTDMEVQKQYLARSTLYKHRECKTLYGADNGNKAEKSSLKPEKSRCPQPNVYLKKSIEIYSIASNEKKNGGR